LRFRTLAKWDNPAESTGLIFFAQLMEELVFTFSHNTYKPSITHTGILCTEAKSTIEEVEQGNIKAPNIGHVASELCNNLQKDLTAQLLCPLPVPTVIKKLKNPKTSQQEIKSIVEILINQLSPSKYKEKNEKLLSDEIKNNAHTAKIRALTRTYITTLLAIGYHPRYIETTTLDFFHYGNNRISGPEAIDEFIEIFKAKQQTYSATFKASRIFNSILDTCKKFDIVISDEIQAPLPNNFSARTNSEVYATIQNINGFDPFSVRESAERRIKLTSTLLTLFHHKETPSWSRDCIISTPEKPMRIIKNTINPMHKCADSKQESASKKLSMFMSNFSLERSSFSKFIRSAQLHSMALESDAEENQLLNLWISLESLIPTETKDSDTANIEHISKSVIPFLNIGYIESLINNLVRDILNWNPKAAKVSFKNVPGKKFTERLIKILSQPEYAENLKNIEDNLRDFHLLKDRVDYFKDLLSSPKKILTALENHEERLTWQIRRIYRARNIIVHSGLTPPYTKQLIEHTHDYLDIILDNLVALGSDPKIAKSTTQGFKYMELQYQSYIEKLNEKNLTFTNTNIVPLTLSQRNS
jgi:hypothetical protein